MGKGVEVCSQRKQSKKAVGISLLSLHTLCVGVNSKEGKLLIFVNDYENSYF